MPASKPAATRSTRLSSLVTSSTTSGYSRANCPSFGARTVVVARGEITKRTRPAGRSRSPEIKSTASRMSPSAGRSRATSCAPASVGATLRVVRASKRTPKRPSSSRIAWDTAEGVTPRRLAARVKLRSSATARNADRTLSSSRTIREPYSLTLVDYSRYCRAVPPVTIAPMDIKRAGSQPSSKGPADWFTGTVRVDPLFQAPDPARAAGASVTFEPGARTAWHTHPLGQTLIVVFGAGRVQRGREPIEEIRPGDVIWISPGEKHWHGASPTTAMTHIAIQEQLNGKAVDWMEKVSDEQYQAGSKANGERESSS